MKKIYYLKTCDTCKRILKSLPKLETFELIDIKENPITIKDLELFSSFGISFENIFSKKAKLYKEMGLKDISLTKDDYKRYLLEHYTFLSRPVIISEDKIFIGNSTKVVESAIEYLKNE